MSGASASLFRINESPLRSETIYARISLGQLSWVATHCCYPLANTQWSPTNRRVFPSEAPSATGKAHPNFFDSKFRTRTANISGFGSNAYHLVSVLHSLARRHVTYPMFAPTSQNTQP